AFVPPTLRAKSRSGATRLERDHGVLRSGNKLVLARLVDSSIFLPLLVISNSRPDCSFARSSDDALSVSCCCRTTVPRVLSDHRDVPRDGNRGLPPARGLGGGHADAANRTADSQLLHLDRRDAARPVDRSVSQ